jgi:hypothetical protein
VRKYKFFIDFDKEEKWLTEICAQGYQLVGKSSMTYHFQPIKQETPPTIRIDFRNFKNKTDFADYCALFEDSGWKHIVGTKSSGAQYFQKMHKSARDGIFSDNTSQSGRYKRLAEMYLMLVCIYLPIFVALISTDAIDAVAFLQPKQLYLTPGLWDKEGADFWGALIFETPFALFRGALWWILPIFMATSLFFAYKANKIYQDHKKA